MGEKFNMEEAAKKAVKEEKTEGTQTSKISYEELNNVAQQLSMQANQLKQENAYLKQQLQNNLSIVRLQMQFKVLEFSKHFDPRFIKETVQEIQEAMTIPEDVEEEKKGE